MVAMNIHHCARLTSYHIKAPKSVFYGEKKNENVYMCKNATKDTTKMKLGETSSQSASRRRLTAYPADSHHLLCLSRIGQLQSHHRRISARTLSLRIPANNHPYLTAHSCQHWKPLSARASVVPRHTFDQLVRDLVGVDLRCGGFLLAWNHSYDHQTSLEAIFSRQ